MNVGMLTSWRTQCGIAQYSMHLARALERAGTGTLILGSRNYGDRALPKEDVAEPIGELACFDVELWNQYGRHELDVERILDLPLDVLHVQYEVVLYSRLRLQQLLDVFTGVTAITYHDSCIPPDMPGPWDLEFRHRDDTGPRGQVIPFGVEYVPPLIRTFGLGRSQDEIIRPICEKHDWQFESTFGENAWLTQTALHDWLREADAIVLWYPETPMAGSSQAARTALATRRPVIVNDTSWFRDLPIGSGVRKVADTPEALESALINVFASPYIEECSWDHVASLHLAAYSEARTNAATQEDIASTPAG